MVRSSKPVRNSEYKRSVYSFFKQLKNENQGGDILYLVKYLVQDKDKTIGAVLIDTNGKEFEISKNIFIKYKDLLQNAIVTENGVMRGKGKSLKKKNIESYAPIQLKTIKNLTKVTHYTIMFEDKEVLFYNKTTDRVETFNEK